MGGGVQLAVAGHWATPLPPARWPPARLRAGGGSDPPLSRIPLVRPGRGGVLQPGHPGGRASGPARGGRTVAHVRLGAPARVRGRAWLPRAHPHAGCRSTPGAARRASLRRGPHGRVHTNQPRPAQPNAPRGSRRADALGAGPSVHDPAAPQVHGAYHPDWPSVAVGPVPDLLPLGMAIARECYPQCLHRRRRAPRSARAPGPPRGHEPPALRAARDVATLGHRDKATRLRAGGCSRKRL